MSGRVLLLPMAALGLLGAHQITYERAASTFGPEHAHMLGVQSWLPAVPSVLVALSLAVLLAVLMERGSRKTMPHPGAVFAAQTTVFVLFEVTDRVVHGCWPIPDLTLLAFAIAVQAPTALLAWVLTRYVLVPAVARLTTPPVQVMVPRAQAAMRPETTTSFSHAWVALAQPLRRGPPLAAVAPC